MYLKEVGREIVASVS